MRMFVAVTPPADVLDDLAAFLEPRRDADTALRWTDPFQWHVTLAFFAQVPDRRIEELAERLQRAASRRTSCTARLSGAGAFPSPDRAKVVWLGAPSQPSEGFARLAEGARAAAVRAGVEVAGGRFRPHLTLARLGHPVDVTRWLRVVECFETGPWNVSSYDLIRSELGQGPGGRPRYAIEGTFPLGPAVAG